METCAQNTSRQSLAKRMTLQSLSVLVLLVLATSARAEEEATRSFADRLDNRLLTQPTAKGLKQGEAVIKTYDLIACLEGQVGVFDWLEVDGYFSLPGILITGGDLRFHTPVSKSWDVSVDLSAGYIDLYILSHRNDSEELSTTHFGGRLEATGREGKHLFNFSLSVHGLYDRNCTGDSCYYEGGTYAGFSKTVPVTAGFGYRYTLNDTWSFHGEGVLALAVPALSDWKAHPDRARHRMEGSITLILTYGARWQAGRFFGDLGFMLPASKWYYEEFKNPALYLGVPFFTVGVAI